METDYHPDWQHNRINFIVSKYGEAFFKDKRILELGPFNGYIGYRFSQMGAKVHCLEGRQENVDFIRSTYPTLTVEQADLDTPRWRWGSWDIIINFGLYYHLHRYHREHLINCINHCDLMFFESVVYDSDDAEIYVRTEWGKDQALNVEGQGGTPSTSYIENIFKEMDVKYTKYSSPSLNGYPQHYDWVDKNSKIFDGGARRFWIVQYDTA